MKRKLELKYGATIGGVSENFTRKQLAWIGAVAMAYNEAEVALHRLFGDVLSLPIPHEVVSSRINGVSGLIEIIRVAAKHVDVSSETRDLLGFALDGEGFSQMKTYRDAVMHATLFDMSSGVGQTSAKKGVREYVLLTEEALEGLYKRLVSLADEIRLLGKVFACARTRTFVQTFRKISGQSDASDQGTVQLERHIQDSIARARQHQTKRRSLPPLPKFPPESDPSAIAHHRREPPVPPPGV